MGISSDLPRQPDSGEAYGIFTDPNLGLASQSPVVLDEGNGAMLIKGEEMRSIFCCRKTKLKNS